MANLIQWDRPSMLSLQRDLDDLMDDYASPRGLRREIARMFEDLPAPQPLWREMDRMFEEYDSPAPLRRRVSRLFENFLGAFRHPRQVTTGSFIPSLDLTEHDAEYVIKADLPGIREQDVDLRIDDSNTLTVSGERREEETKQVRGYEYSERTYGSFSRSVSLPAGIDASKIEADFRNGVLEIHVPKLESTRARKIPLSRSEPRVMAPTNGPVVQVPQGQPRAS